MELCNIFGLLLILPSLTQCQRPQPGGVTFLDGDVYIEAVNSLYSPRADGSCRDDEIDPEVVQNIESVRWTLMQLNGDAANTLFDKKIGEYKELIAKIAAPFLH